MAKLQPLRAIAGADLRQGYDMTPGSVAAAFVGWVPQAPLTAWSLLVDTQKGRATEQNSGTAAVHENLRVTGIYRLTSATLSPSNGADRA